MTEVCQSMIGTEEVKRKIVAQFLAKDLAAKLLVGRKVRRHFAPNAILSPINAILPPFYRQFPHSRSHRTARSATTAAPTRSPTAVRA